MIPHEDKVDVITPVNILLMMMIIMTFVSVEQRPGWGEEVYVGIGFTWIYHIKIIFPGLFLIL